MRDFKRLMAQKGLKLVKEIDLPGEELVMGDAGRITQVLNNLLGNAGKFTSEVSGRCKMAMRRRRTFPTDFRFPTPLARRAPSPCTPAKPPPLPHPQAITTTPSPSQTQAAASPPRSFPSSSSPSVKPTPPPPDDTAAQGWAWRSARTSSSSWVGKFG